MRKWIARRLRECGSSEQETDVTLSHLRRGNLGIFEAMNLQGKFDWTHCPSFLPSHCPLFFAQGGHGVMCNKNSAELGTTSRLCTSMVTNAPSVCLAVAKFWCFRLARGARRQSDQRTASCQVLNSVYTVYTQLSLVCQGHHHALTRPWPATNNITAIYYLYNLYSTFIIL